MEYEEIWQRIKGMSRQERKLLAHEVSLHLKQSTGSLTEGEDRYEGADAVGYIHPHYYFDAKGVHDILFYETSNQYLSKRRRFLSHILPPAFTQRELNDDKGLYYKTLKGILENDDCIHILYRRRHLFLHFINDYLEKKAIKSYICSRLNSSYTNVRSSRHAVFITLSNGSHIVYKMNSCKPNTWVKSK